MGQNQCVQTTISPRWKHISTPTHHSWYKAKSDQASCAMHARLQDDIIWHKSWSPTPQGHINSTCSPFQTRFGSHSIQPLSRCKPWKTPCASFGQIMEDHHPIQEKSGSLGSGKHRFEAGVHISQDYIPASRTRIETKLARANSATKKLSRHQPS